MYFNNHPIINNLFPSFVTGAQHFNNTLKHRAFTFASGPAAPSGEWSLMFNHWEPIQYLLGGTLAMRAAGEKYLPKKEGELRSDYDARLLRSVLYGAYSRTVKTLSALPFLTPVQVKNIPKELEYLLKHANGDDDDIQTLGQQLVSDLINYGKCHIAVDFPINPGNLSLQEERDLNIRPYFSRIDPIKAIGWTYEVIGSKRELTSFRVFEDQLVEDPLDQWQENLQQQVRVIYRDRIELHKNTTVTQEGGGGSSSNSFELDETLPNTLGRVNVVTVYANKTGYMTSRPVLEELAHLNIKHWNKLSDLDNIEHVANVPFAYATGVPENQLDTLTISPHGLLCIPDENVTLAYLEHSGAAIGAGQTSIDQLEARMVAMGADTLAARPTSTRETASSKIMDNTKSNSVLQSAVVNLERGLEECFSIAGEWINVNTEKVAVNIGDKMTLTADANTVTSLLTLSNEGKLSIEDLTMELQRRGTLSESSSLKEPPKPDPMITPVSINPVNDQDGDQEEEDAEQVDNEE